MRLTLLTSAIASIVFAATFALAPAIADAGERLTFGQVELVSVSAPQPKPVLESRECRSAFQKIVAGLRHKDCK